MSNGGRVPHGEFNKQLERVKDICPTITRNIINRAMHIHWTSLKCLMDEDECVVVSNEDNDTNANFSRDRGGRPVGTTIICKHENKLRRVKVHKYIVLCCVLLCCVELGFVVLCFLLLYFVLFCCI